MTTSRTNSAGPTEPSTIDMTPTWGEIGLLFMRLALSDERRAVEAMRSEVARAMAAAQALSQIMPTLSEEQARVVSTTMVSELKKQGF
jgi:hypothetical protein